MNTNKKNHFHKKKMITCPFTLSQYTQAKEWRLNNDIDHILDHDVSVLLYSVLLIQLKSGKRDSFFGGGGGGDYLLEFKLCRFLILVKDSDMVADYLITCTGFYCQCMLFLCSLNLVNQFINQSFFDKPSITNLVVDNKMAETKAVNRSIHAFKLVPNGSLQVILISEVITSSCHASALTDHVTTTGHNLEWDLFELLARDRSDTHCKIKKTLLIRELKPTLNDNVCSKKLYLILNLKFYLVVTFISKCHF